MNPNEIDAHAARIVSDHLYDGIEFCVVYEDDELQDATEEDWRAIHDLANEKLRALA